MYLVQTVKMIDKDNKNKRIILTKQTILYLCSYNSNTIFIYVEYYNFRRARLRKRYAKSKVDR